MQLVLLEGPAYVLQPMIVTPPFEDHPSPFACLEGHIVIPCFSRMTSPEPLLHFCPSQLSSPFKLRYRLTHTSPRVMTNLGTISLGTLPKEIVTHHFITPFESSLMTLGAAHAIALRRSVGSRDWRRGWQ